MQVVSPTRVRVFRSVWLLAGLPLLLWSACGYAGTSTATSLTLSSTSVPSGTAITLTASVLAGATHVTPGSIVFCNASATRCADAAIVGRAQLTSSGTAAIKIIPGIGTHSYKAVFQGTSTYTTSTSSSVSMTVTGFFPTTTTFTQSGSAGSYTLTATVTSYSNLPSYPYGMMDFEDASNGNYLFGTGSVGSGSYAEVFVAAGSNSTPGAPRRSASADFNGDGKPDLVIGDQFGSGIAVFLGNGDGTFTAAAGSPIATGSEPIAVATGDFNNDGFPDIAVANYSSGTMSILLGNGDGTFQTAASITGVTEPDAIAVTDVNRDGNLDLVFPSQSGNGVYVYFGNGTGNFTAGGTFSTGSGPYSVAAADLNGDGNPDLVIGNDGASSVTVLLGDGTGNFTAASGSPVTVGTNPWNLVAVDLNNDGKVDIVAADAGDANLSTLIGNGDGTFAAYTTYPLASGVKELAAGDFNADGDTDVAVCNYSNSTLSILLGGGNGYFFAGPTQALPTTGCLGVVVADYNGDGLPDIETTLVGNSTSNVSINQVQHSASATFGPGAIPGHGSHNIFAYYPGDYANAASSSSTAALTATPATTTLTLSAAPSSSTYPQQVALTATLSPYIEGTQSTAGETITFYNGGSSIGTANLSAGVASLNVTSLPAGSDSLTASYPTDSNFAASTSNTLTYTVSKATPTITWTTPSAITYGTALSSTQLNASSGGVAGSFAYSPATGTVLGAGAGQTLSVTFTPTDTTDYNSASGSTTITVNQAAKTITFPQPVTPVAVGSTATLMATTSNGDAVTYTVTSGTASISGATVTYTNSGTVTIAANSAATANYAAAATVSDSVTVNMSASAYTAPATNVGSTSATQTAMVNIVTAGTLNTISVLTQGISNLDYAYVSGGTCAPGTSYTVGQSCSVNYAFTPKYPGQRMGAVSLTISAGQLLGVSYLTGTGLGPLLALTPAVISTVAGNGTAGYAGDGGAATSAQISQPYRAIRDTVGNVYITDTGNYVVRKVTVSTGIISTVAGNGTQGFSGNGGSATSAKLGTTSGVGVDALGNIYIADIQNCRIRKVTVATGIITTVVGSGTCGYSGDNGLATSAAINNYLSDIAFDGTGNYYFADQVNDRVREVNIATGVITTVAGTGTAGFSGDGGPAISAKLSSPNCVALDVSGNLYVTDQNNNRIREVNVSTGTITTVAGNGTQSYSGDGGAATSAALNQPYGAVVDAAGNIYIADSHNYRVRMVSAATGNISTIAGNGSSSFSGDGGAATLAGINVAADVSLDGAGNLLIADPVDSRIRLLTVASGPSLTFANTAYGASSAATNETVSNIGNATLTVASVAVPANFSLGGASTTCTTGSQTVASGANCVLGIEFAPTTVGSLSGTLTLTDNSLNAAGTTQTINLSGTAIKATPTVTWGTPSAITYGTALSATQLNATSGGVAGTFVYTPASGTVLGAGAGQTLSVAFTPTDPTSYNNASGTTTITVNQATPTISVTTSASSAGYGTAVTFTATLSNGASGTVTFLDSGVSIGTGTISGTTATFTTSSLSVGSHTITVSWPGNTNYTSASSASLTQTIVRSAVTLVEVSSLNPSLFGDAVTLSITATGSGATPTGTVTLTNNGTSVMTLSLSGSGTTSYTTSTLTAATHTLTVTYSGDGNYF